MRKTKEILLISTLTFVIILNSVASFAIAVTYNGATTISTNTILDEEEYSSSTPLQNAILVIGGTSSISSSRIHKTGDSDGTNGEDLYGINAAVAVTNGQFSLGSSIDVETEATYATGVHAYGDGIVNMASIDIKTSSSNSSGIVVTNGGTASARFVGIETSGNNSPAVRCDNGGGTFTGYVGVYETDGENSPAFYTTSSATLEYIDLNSNKSEGIVIEGENDELITLHMADSDISTKNKDSIKVKNAKTNLDLERTYFYNTNREGESHTDILRLENSDVTMNCTTSLLDGYIYADNNSNLTINLTESSEIYRNHKS